MKTTGIISALIFAHAAFAQATDSTSAAVSAATGSGSASAATLASSASGSASSPAVVSTSAGVSSSGSASASASASGTKTGTKSASSAAGTSAAAATTSSVDAGSSGGSPTTIPLAETSAVSSSSGNPLVPDSAGTTCTDFLNQLNSDTAMSSCFTPLLNALSAFNPTSGSASASAITKTLNNLCASNACPASTMRAKLTAYKDACGGELTSSAADSTVVKMYDVLYTIIPFKSAMCAKDQDTQAYCLLNIGTGSSVGNTTQNLATGPSEPVKYAEGHLADALVSSRRRAQSVLVPNTDTYRNTNLVYLFTSPDMNSGELCTSCTQQIVSKYIAWESATPHALGLKNSPLLGGQSELWTAIQEKCPATFLSEVSNIAGVASADQISGAAPALTGGMATALLGALAALAFI